MHYFYLSQTIPLKNRSTNKILSVKIKENQSKLSFNPNMSVFPFPQYRPLLGQRISHILRIHLVDLIHHILAFWHLIKHILTVLCQWILHLLRNKQVTSEHATQRGSDNLINTVIQMKKFCRLRHSQLELTYCITDFYLQYHVFCLRLTQSVVKLHNLVSMHLAIWIRHFHSIRQVFYSIKNTFGSD